MTHTRDPFWSKVYIALGILTLLGLIIYARVGESTLLALALCAFMLIGIIAMDSDHQARKKKRRQNMRKPAIDIPDDKLTRDLQAAIHYLDEQEERDRRVRSETEGMGSVGDLEDTRRKP